MKKNKFVKFHVAQSIVLVITGVVLSVGVGILSSILVITIIGILLIPILWMVV